MSRKMGPLAPDHPAVGTPCACCGNLIASADHVTLMTVLPADLDELAKADAGRPHTATAVVIHWECRSERPIGWG